MNILIKNGNSNTNKGFKLFVVLFIFVIAINHSNAQLQITKHTINNGGGMASGGTYVIKSSIGQIDAKHSLIGGDYHVNGGFWNENQDLIYKNGLEN
jgi:hypothetical protein